MLFVSKGNGNSGIIRSKKIHYLKIYIGDKKSTFISIIFVHIYLTSDIDLAETQNNRARLNNVS